MTVAVEGFPLSWQQEHTWRHGAGLLPIAQAVVAVDGDGSDDDLHAVVERLTRTHEILRTTFDRHPVMAAPLQVVREDAELNWRTLPWDPCTSAVEDAAMGRLLADARAAAWQESRTALSVATARVGDCRRLIVLTLPALCADEATLEQFPHELALAEDAVNRDGNVIQYAQFGDWHRQAVAALSLSGLTGISEGPARLNATVEATGVASASALEAIAEHVKLDAECVALAVYLTVISRYAPTTDVMLHHSLDWRRTGQLHRLLGPATDARAASLHVDERDSIADVARRVHTLLHPWVGSAAKENSASLDASLAVGFKYRRRPAIAEGRRFRFELLHAEFPALRRADLFEFGITHGDELITHVAAERPNPAFEWAEAIPAAYAAAISNLASSPSRIVSEVSLATERTQHSMLVAGRGRRASVNGKRIHELVRDQARLDPKRLAVIVGPQRATYGEIAARAAAIAARLVDAGVRRGDTVGIALPRSPDVVASMLAAFGAGAAFVPLDPSLPPARFRVLVEEARLSVGIAASAEAAALFASAGATSVDLAGVTNETRQVDVHLAPQDLAYVIFTSGSTGRPKAVAVEHGQIENYIAAVARLGITNAPSFATAASTSADLGYTAIFSALCTGATLHLVPEDRVLDALWFDEQASEHEIGCLKITPSHLAGLLDGGASRCLPSDTLVLGGEPPSWELVRRVKKLAPWCQVINHYGPTEATIGSAAYVLPGGEPLDEGGSIPFGPPLANVELYVVDAEMTIQPPGAPGELLIGGAGVTRGYLHAPAQTAQAFVPDPFSGRVGARLYRTGDLARARGDGTFVFVGRRDDQVKLRGFRVELAEIDSQVAAVDGVRQAAARLESTKFGDGRVVVYVVPERTSRFDGEAVQQALREQLPAHMLPSAIVPVEQLPLTASGKVDRRALAQLSDRADGAVKPPIEPRTEAERLLVQVWSETLGVEDVGIDDNFFELGGDSILSIQVISRASRAGLRLRPRHIFEYQTIAELAAAAGAPLTQHPPPRSDGDSIPLTPIQTWFFRQHHRHVDHWNQVITLRAVRPIDFDLLREAVKRLVACHAALRLRFRPEASGWIQTVAPNERADLVRRFETTSETLAGIGADLQRSLDLQKGPLLRVALVDCGPNQPQALIIVCHHLAIDGVSWRVLLDDLDFVYRELAEGRSAMPPEEQATFADWANALVAWSATPAPRGEEAYWRDILNHICALPRDAQGENAEASADSIDYSLSTEETLLLLRDAPSAYRAQVLELLVAAFCRAMASFIPDPSVVITLEGHGREHLPADLDTSRTIGWFTTRFPVHLPVDDTVSVDETVACVKEILRRIPSKGLGFGVLTSTVPEALRLNGPEPDVSFNYLGQFDQTLLPDSCFRLSDDPSGPTRDPDGLRPQLVTLESIVIGGCLNVSWVFSSACHQRSRIERLGDQFMAQLRHILAEVNRPHRATPSDFPRAGIDAQELERLEDLLTDHAAAEAVETSATNES